MWDKIQQHVKNGGLVIDRQLDVYVISLCDDRIVVGDKNGVYAIIDKEKEGNSRFVQLSNFEFEFE